MAEQFVRLQLTRRQVLQVLDVVDHHDDAVTFDGTVNGQPVTVRISAAEEAPPPAPVVVSSPRPTRCPCKSGSARDPGTHNNQIRNQGRCHCYYHST